MEKQPLRMSLVMPESVMAVPRMPPLYALRAFEVAARFGSFTQAAQSLFITQSAVSRHVKTLEEHLDCQLFERHGSRLVLTDAGQPAGAGAEDRFPYHRERLRRGDAPARRASPQGAFDADHALAARRAERLSAGSSAESCAAHQRRMDLDAVDFTASRSTARSCWATAVFLADWRRVKLFDEWLVPVCAPELLGAAPWSTEQLAAAELIHPSRDCRDWRRWLQRTGRADEVARQQGKLFDTLELGIRRCPGAWRVDRRSGAGRCRAAARQSVPPFGQAVKSGDSYYRSGRPATTSLPP